MQAKNKSISNYFSYCCWAGAIWTEFNSTLIMSLFPLRTPLGNKHCAYSCISDLVQHWFARDVFLPLGPYFIFVALTLTTFDAANADTSHSPITPTITPTKKTDCTRNIVNIILSLSRILYHFLAPRANKIKWRNRARPEGLFRFASRPCKICRGQTGVIPPFCCGSNPLGRVLILWLHQTN